MNRCACLYCQNNSNCEDYLSGKSEESDRCMLYTLIQREDIKREEEIQHE